ncbi:hemagglutinin repeat-containing protein [Haemophilus parainfluenzae]|uniref:two-partner secretion domain-containing protein n=1 Tax=Haemophilus parainfluenzae TaxID=729 RepID=UPI001873A516|nr:hemagglutinin repeat-containing protein [Haemophilus parainfluenzae]MBE4953222.1 hemagglutinin repeat-containing protein [Haemophilus parainfluenzae]
MNKRHYKVIFSRVLNQLVVVSELAKSQGKAQSENVSSEQEKTGLFSTALSLNPIHFSLMLALGFVFLSPSVHAEDMAIRADKSAPGNQQPTVLQTGNGLPQVNIQTPSAGGVSRNQYSQFDVAEKGAVLNNARKAAQTQMAGWVQGNPNLARGEAKVILNEVNSANPSRLKGYVEVAGKKADVVIANPSGIQCDGCGVINAGRTTLTTGKADVENGELKGYRVKGGKVTVGQKGMDNSQSDYTDIIAEKAEINGGVWSKKGIKVTTGKNNVDRTNDSVVYVGDKITDKTDHTSDTQGENQSYSVDVSQLGGMYAEKIHLVDNGQGLGVRNAGHIGASAGDVKIDSQGRIVNEGVISGKQDVQINTKSDFVQNGKVETARGDVLVGAKNKITQTGSTISGGHIRYQADSVEAGKSSVLAAGVEENGKARKVDEVGETKNLEIKTVKTTVAKGKNISSGKVDVQAKKVDVSESQTSGQDVHIVAHKGEINANQATLVAKNEINLHTPSQLLTQHANLKADWIGATAQGVENQHGRWASQGTRDFSLNLEKGLNNEKGLILSGGNMSLTQQNQFLNNREGRLLSGKDLTLTALSVDNRAGMLVADGSSTLNIARDINNQKVGNTGSLIQAQGDLTVNTTNLNNQNTKGNAQSVPTQGILAGKVEVNANQLDNKQGGIYSVSSQVLNVVNQLENTQGELFSTGDIRIQGRGASIKNSQGSIQAAEKLNIQVNALSGDGDIEANHTNIQLVQDFDSQRDLVGRSSLSLTTKGNLINRAGLLSEGYTQVNAKNIENTETAEIQGKQTVLSGEQNITNRGLIKGTVENVIKTGDTLTNIGTGRIYGNHVALQAGKKIVNTDELQSDGTIKSAVVAAKERLDVAAPLVENNKTVFTKDFAFNGLGGTFASEGKIVFGRSLDENNQAQGLGDLLLNRGALIDGKGVVFGMKLTKNENARLITRLEEVDRQKVNEHYLVEGGNPNANERIDFNLLKWVPFSRSGKVAYKTDNPVMATDANIDGKIIAQPGESICVNKSNCSIVEYNKNDPIWAALGVTPPKTEAPKLTVPKELLIKPEEPEMPERMYFGNARFYKKKMQEYELKLAEYKAAMKTYEEKLEPYKEQLAPYFKWQLENESAFKALSDAIEAHNSKIEGKRFTNFWDIYVRERIKSETQVKETHPGKILSQGDLEYHGGLVNDRGQVLASGKIYNPNEPSAKVQNLAEWGITRFDERGDQEWTYNRWRGGRRFYHQREWAGRHAHQRITDTPLDLKQVRTEAYTTVTPEGEKANLSMETIALANNINVANGVNQSNAKAGQHEIRTIGADVSLPTSSLYRTNPEATNRPLIETDPQFTDRKQWLSGDYMFKALRSDPQNILKRLGDGYYEQRLVRDQVNQLTGRMFLTGYQDLEAQYKGLMDNGITFAKRFNLTPGVALSPAQVAQLTSDIVWFEEKEVTLPSGKQVKVMAPRVYAMAQKGDLNGEGALISADVIDLRSNRLTNSGTIAGRKLTLLNTESLLNEGAITGDKVGIKTTNNFDNIGGKVEAERALLVDVGGDLNHESTTMATNVDLSHFQRSETTLGRKALFHVKGEDGQLQLLSNNLNAKGADIVNDGNGNTLVQTKNNMNLTALSVGFDEKMGKGNHYRHEKVEEAVVSQVKGKGNVLLTGKNILSEGAQLDSEAKLMAIAENDLVLNGAKESRDFEEFHKTKSGSVAKVTKTSLDQQQSVTQVGTQVSGKDVVLSAGHDVKAKAIQAIADDNLHIQAGHDVDIAADTNHFKNKRVETKKTSGVFTGGGIGITFGSKSEKHDYETEGWTQSDARSTLGSMNGNIRVSAGNHSNVMGTDMITPRTNRIDIEGASVKVEAGKDIIERKEGHEYKQSGLTIAVTSPVVSTAQSMGHSIKRSREVKNEKLKQLHQMKAAYDSLELAQNAANVTNTVSNLGNMTEGNVSNPSIKVSVSVGASKSTQTSESKTITHSGSELNAGTVNLTSRKGDVDVLGSTLNAKRLELDVAKNLNVESVQDTYHNRSENKNTGWSVGVFAGANGNSYGIGVEGSAQVGKGHENSDSVTQRNSYLNAEETIIKTGKDANFKGAVVKTDRLEADIQGNLNLESRQDSNHYDSKQTQAGAGFSVAIYGSGSSAQANYSQNKAKVNYAQVEEQTGFHVGKGGMDVKVAGNTHLAGSVIDSEAAQDKNHFQTKSLTHTDIENRSEVDVKSVSAGLSTDMAQNAKNAMAAAASALGNKHESATSQTQSAIGSNIQIDTETPENLTALSRDTQNANHKVKAFDHNEVKEQQEAAQVAGELFAKVTGDLAKKFEFEDGSKEKIAMHALAGALAAKMSDGNVATGAAAGASSEWLNTYVTDYLNEQAKDLKLDDGQKEKLKQAAQQMTALVIGAAAGAVSGGTSETMKQGALTSYNAETYNRQLHQNEKERIKLLANGDEEKERRLEIAACALVHCSAQIPEDDPRYAAEYQKEILGNTAEFANERSLLQKQTYTLDSWGAGASYPLFNYNLAYKMQDYDDAHTQIVTRAGGVAQTAYGIGTAVGGGVTSCMGLATCGFGVVAGLYGLDHTLAGVKTIWTGKASQTAGGDFISKTFGMEQGSGELLYGFANPLIATSVGNVTKSAFLGDFSKGMTKGVDSTKELPIIGQVAGYSQTEAILNGVKINNFKGATPDSLSRINNFLSNTIDTTRGKGIRNATKPSYIDIETDWGALTKSAKVKNYDNGRRVAEFSDGTRAIYRPSKTGPMTIELQRPDNKKIIEVRYER